LNRIQPFYYIVALSGIFILVGLILFVMQIFSTAESTAVPVDPQTNGQADAIYDLWFSSSEVYDITIDHALTGILFSNDNNSVTLLDRERRLRWDKLFATAPVQAKISSCGNYAVIGTAGGRVYFSTTDQESWWDHEGNPVEKIVVSPSANWIVVARARTDQLMQYLDLFNKEGELMWSLETGPIENLYLTSEYLEQANIYYTTVQDEVPHIHAVNIKGEDLWTFEGQILAAVSKHGSRLAAIESNRIVVYDSLGYALWSTTLPFEATNVLFNPQNYNRLLVYGPREGAGENLYHFDLAEDLLWMYRIPDDSLFTFTPDGQYVIASSWRHFKEDYTQMILLDREGKEVNSWEVAMRVEHLLSSGHPHLFVVCGEDGYIDLVDINPLLAEGSNDNGSPELSILYNPVSTGIRPNETMLRLYFADENANLIPVTRSVSFTDEPLYAALDELIRGPARGSSLYRTIPNRDIYKDLQFNPGDGSLIVYLDPGLFRSNGIGQSDAAFSSLLLTISAFEEVKEIYLYLEGELIEKFGETDIAGQPVYPFRYTNPVYRPVASGDRYYLQIREGAAEGLDDNELADLVEIALQGCRALPFVPSDLRLIKLELLPEVAWIDLNSSLRAVFPEDPTEKERLQAALVLDAIFTTVFANSNVQRAEISIDGRSWSTPAGYPASSRFYRQPYYINPE